MLREATCFCHGSFRLMTRCAPSACLLLQHVDTAVFAFAGRSVPASYYLARTYKRNVLPSNLAVQSHEVLDHHSKQACANDCSWASEGQAQQSSHVEHLERQDMSFVSGHRQGTIAEEGLS